MDAYEGAAEVRRDDFRRDYRNITNSLRRMICYDCDMTKDQVKEVLERVLTWPPERQADVVHVVELMEQQDTSSLRLSEEQAAEIRRRLAE